MKIAAAALVGGSLLAGCGGAAKTALVPGGDRNAGAALISKYGCGACHRIGGIDRANGHVGPSLKHFKENIPFIAGKLPNTPANVERWIQNPQGIAPQTIMPDLGVTPQQARDITAYLYGQ